MSLRIIIIFALTLVRISCLTAAENRYKFSDIPAELLENAKAIIRYEKFDFEVFSPARANLNVQFAITIINENGLGNSIFLESYNSFSRISKIRATVYNEKGEAVKRIKQDEIIDHSAIFGYTLYQDNRLKFIDPKYKTYPFTVEYFYEIEYSGYLNYPGWCPNQFFNVSVQESNFQMTVPKDNELRYREYNLKNLCEKTESEKNIKYNWQVKNQKAEIREDFSKPAEEYLPIVYTSPSDIDFGGYEGNFSSWSNFGKWIKLLNNGKDKLGSETNDIIAALTKNSENEMAKIKVLYEYLQNKTRYVSIQVGIGGWQPFEAEIVDKYSYGDCKALSNYMKSLLKSAGINSYYTLIKAGFDVPNCLTEFPSNQFNHAILCVPLKHDTIWLECTSQNIPFGYLGTFTDDRDALMITDSGGVLIHTPLLSIWDNLRQTNALISLDNDCLNCKADISIKYGGMYYDKMQQFLHSDNSFQKRYIDQNISTPGSTVQTYNLKEDKSRNPYLTLSLEIEINKVSSSLNNRIIIPVNLFSKTKEIPVKSSGRKSDVLLKRSYLQIDTIQFVIPENFQLDKLPGEQFITSIFGNYYSGYNHSGNSIQYIRKMEMYKGTYPATDYDKIITFFENIEKHDNDKFILIRKSQK